MIVWILSICIGVSWMGCGVTEKFVMPDEHSCYRAAREARLNSGPDIAAYCRPREMDTARSFR